MWKIGQIGEFMADGILGEALGFYGILAEEEHGRHLFSPRSQNEQSNNLLDIVCLSLDSGFHIFCS